MKLSQLQFQFPEELIALSPQRPSRVLWDSDEGPIEITMEDLKNRFQPGDVLVVNNTKVIPRRVFAGDLEILFLDEISEGVYQTLFPAKKMKIGESLELPGGRRMTLLEKGLPQKVKVEPNYSVQDFQKFGEMPLPPYIQKARGERHAKTEDPTWYQTAWAKVEGSFASPTASLHFQKEDLLELQNKGVDILEITLHVGLGTFLPVQVQDLKDHKMHSEYAEVKFEVWEKIKSAKANGFTVWALGTTVTRTLESIPLRLLNQISPNGDFSGRTDLMILPGFEFQVVDRLLTNFHQPETTLLALVSAFAGFENVQINYAWAIEKKFRLFSYGDLSVWPRHRKTLANRETLR